MAAVAPAQRPWFFGPAPDLLLGCGLLYGLFFALQAAAGPAMRETAPYAWLPLLTLVFGAPHYGATLLRVYERRADRRKYVIFAVYLTAALAVLFVAGLHEAWIGSLLVTVYLTWSPWHYSGQNYGIAVLFLRRRGVPLPQRAKRLLYGSFALSYALTFLVLHAETGGQAYVPGSYDGTVFRLLSLGIPREVHVPLFLLVEAGYLACVAGAFWMLIPHARGRDLMPTACVVLVQAAWFAVPTVATEFGAFQGLEPLSRDHRAYAFMWVALGHFLQYLWITTYYAAASESPAGRLRYLVRALFAGAAIWVLPTLFFAPGLLGSLPFDVGLGLLTASVVNLHHFILDGAIWKLRDGAIARVLLRDPGADAPPGAPPPARRIGLRAGLLAAGAAAWALSVALLVDSERAKSALDQGDLARFAASVERRARVGRDSPVARLRLARHALRKGDSATALANARRSRELHPSADAWLVEGAAHHQRGEWEAALAAYRAALALEPERVEALRRVGLLWYRLGRSTEAREALERAVALAPEDPGVRSAWERVHGP